MNKSSVMKGNYGIDAPPVIRNLLLGASIYYRRDRSKICLLINSMVDSHCFINFGVIHWGKHDCNCLPYDME